MWHRAIVRQTAAAWLGSYLSSILPVPWCHLTAADYVRRDYVNGEELAGSAAVKEVRRLLLPSPQPLLPHLQPPPAHNLTLGMTMPALYQRGFPWVVARRGRAAIEVLDVSRRGEFRDRRRPPGQRAGGCGWHELVASWPTRPAARADIGRQPVRTGRVRAASRGKPNSLRPPAVGRRSGDMGGCRWAEGRCDRKSPRSPGPIAHGWRPATCAQPKRCHAGR